MPTAIKPSREQKEFLRGFACALGALAREHGEPSMAADIAVINGITYQDLKHAGVEPFDLKPLRSEMLHREQATRKAQRGKGESE